MISDLKSSRIMESVREGEAVDAAIDRHIGETMNVVLKDMFRSTPPRKRETHRNGTYDVEQHSSNTIPVVELQTLHQMFGEKIPADTIVGAYFDSNKSVDRTASTLLGYQADKKRKQTVLHDWVRKVATDPLDKCVHEASFRAKDYAKFCVYNGVPDSRGDSSSNLSNGGKGGKSSSPSTARVLGAPLGAPLGAAKPSRPSVGSENGFQSFLKQKAAEGDASKAKVLGAIEGGATKVKLTPAPGREANYFGDSQSPGAGQSWRDDDYYSDWSKGKGKGGKKGGKGGMSEWDEWSPWDGWDDGWYDDWGKAKGKGLDMKGKGKGKDGKGKGLPEDLGYGDPDREKGKKGGKKGKSGKDNELSTPRRGGRSLEDRINSGLDSTVSKNKDRSRSPRGGWRRESAPTSYDEPENVEPTRDEVPLKLVHDPDNKKYNIRII